MRLIHDILCRLSVGFGRGRGRDAEKLFVAGDQVSVFVQVADDQVGGFAHFGAQAERAQLPGEVVGKVRRLGEEILERGTLDVLHLAVGAVTGIEIVLEERAEIDLFERIFLFDGGDGIFFVGGGSGAFAVFFFLADFVEQRNRVFQFFENRVLDHLSIDHVLELKLVEREDRDHLHQARGKDLALRELNAEFVL